MTKSINNNILLVEEFMLEDNYRTAKCYKFTHHTIIHEVCLDYHLGWLILRKRLGYAKSFNTIIGRLGHEYDTDILQ